MAGGATCAQRGGFFHPLVEPGEQVFLNQVVGFITDPHGNTVEEVQATSNGVVCEIRHVPTVRPGDEVFILGEIIGEAEKTL